MAGLLDEYQSLLQPDPEADKRGFYTGLISAGAALLANRNRDGAGAAAAHFANAMNQANDPNAQLRRLQMAAHIGELRDRTESRQAQREAMQGLSSHLTPEQQAFVAAKPELLGEIFKQKNNPDMQLVTVAGPDGTPMQRWIRKGESTGIDIGPAPTKEGALPWYVRRGSDGKTTIDPAFAEFERSKASAGTPYYQFLPTSEGYAVGNARTGQIAQAGANGRPVMKASDDPALQGRIAGAKEFAKTSAEDQAKAQSDYPRIVQNANTALKYADELIKHPGFTQAVGASSMLGIQKIPGTNAKDFMSRLDQIKGGAFLEAFNTLKGGGQITEVEGKKATDAIARMDNSTSEAEFRAAVKDYTDVIRAGMNRAKMRAGNRPPQSQESDPLGIR